MSVLKIKFIFALLMSLPSEALSFASLQDTFFSQGESDSFSLGAGVGTGKASEKNSGSFGFSNAKDRTDSAWVNNQTSLIGTDSVNITDAKNLNLTTNELLYNTISDHYTTKTSGFGFSTGFGQSTDQGKSTLKPNGSTTLTFKNTSKNQNQHTNTTLSQGNITIAGNTNPDLTDLNRDVNTSQEITKDIITGTLNGSITIDNRIFTNAGRKEIDNQHENLGKALKDASNTPVAIFGLTYGTIGSMLSKNGEIRVNDDGTINFITSGFFGANDTAINLAGPELYFGSHPDEVRKPYQNDPQMSLSYHETPHTSQWQNEGIIFGIKYLFSETAREKYEENASKDGVLRMQKEGIYDGIQKMKEKTILTNEMKKSLIEKDKK